MASTIDYGATAQFICELLVRDPDTQNEVEVTVFKHQNGGLFAIDSSYLVGDLADLATVNPEDVDSDLVVPDPFASITPGVSPEARVRLSGC